MNARLYNPNLHRFLSPDPIISDPYNTQHYNRHGYCWNNPLKHVDITGNEPILLTAIVIGAIIGAGSYAVMCMTGHADWSFKGGALAIITGAVSGAVTCGIGTWAQGFNNFWSQASVSALAHGTFQGSMTAIQGGKFWSGFAAGAVSSIVSSAIMGGDTTGKVNGVDKVLKHHKGIAASLGMNRTVGTLATAAISGGAASALTGGNFWQGAATGLIIAGLNHFGHDMLDDDSMFDDVQTQEKDIDFYELFEKVMSNKVGTTLTADQIIKKYNLPAKLKSAINSMKLVSKNKIFVDWNNEGKINFASKINVKDGILSVKRGFVPSKPGAKLGSNGYIISGDGLNYQPSLWSSESFSPVFVTRTGIFGYFPKTNTITSTGASL